MGRKSLFSDNDLFQAVGRAMAARGEVTLKSVSDASGVSIGSIYHRFGSREGLLAATWQTAVETFQDQFLAALTGAGADAGLEAALATPRFCRAYSEMALVLACCRPVDFISRKTPEAQRREIAVVNDRARSGMQKYARQVGKPLDICRLAIVSSPLACVQLYLPKRPVPKQADVYIRCAYKALMSDQGSGGLGTAR